MSNKRKLDQLEGPDVTKKTKVDVPSSNFTYSSLQRQRTLPASSTTSTSNSSQSYSSQLSAASQQASSRYSYTELKKQQALAQQAIQNQKQPQLQTTNNNSSSSNNRSSNNSNSSILNQMSARSLQKQQPISIIQQQPDGTKKAVLPLKVDPQKILQRLALPPNLKEVLPPDIQKLKEYAKKKELRKRELQRLIREGKIKMPEKRTAEDEQSTEVEAMPQNMQQNEFGELRDEKGNLIKISDSNRTSLKINKHKKQQEKLKKIMKLTQSSQKNTVLYDQHIVMTTNQKRDKRKIHALHFIEKGSIALKADALRRKIQGEDQQQQQQLQSDPNNPNPINNNNNNNNPSVTGESAAIIINGGINLNSFGINNSNSAVMAGEGGVSGEQMILNKKEENQKMMNETNLPTGLKRVSVKIKHHDPIPNVEWWDLPLIDNKKSYLSIQDSLQQQQQSQTKTDNLEKGSGASDQPTQQQQAEEHFVQQEQKLSLEISQLKEQIEKQQQQLANPQTTTINSQENAEKIIDEKSQNTTQDVASLQQQLVQLEQDRESLLLSHKNEKKRQQQQELQHQQQQQQEGTQPSSNNNNNSLQPQPEGQQSAQQQQLTIIQSAPQLIIESYAGSEANLEKIKQMSFDSKYYKGEQVTHYIEHPIPFKGMQLQQNAQIPFYLTREERKKVRRKRRMEKERDKQDKIKLGLMPPPPNKVKINNMMNVLTDDAIQDPTHLENEVRKAMALRKQQHQERNDARKLTKEQKAEKSLRKLKRDSAVECRVAIFRVENLSSGAHRFKVDKNAQQLQLHGLCLIPDRNEGFKVPAVIVVEGGPKAIKFYKKLMLRRIKWDHSGLQQEEAVIAAEQLLEQQQQQQQKTGEADQQDDNNNKDKIEVEGEANKEQQEQKTNNVIEEEEDKDKAEEKKKLNEKQEAVKIIQKKHHHHHRKINPELFGNKCSLVWEGVIKDHNFNKWRVVDVRSEMEAKRALAERGVEDYYDIVMNYKDNE